MNYWRQSKNNIYVAAHRGWSEKYPENTMLAFRAAAELGVDQIHGEGLAGEGHVLRCAVDHIHNPAIVRLQFDDLALRSDLRLEDTAQQRICNDRVCGLVLDIVAGERAALRDYSKFIRFDNSNHAPAVQNIKEEIPIPVIGQCPIKNGNRVCRQQEQGMALLLRALPHHIYSNL